MKRRRKYRSDFLFPSSSFIVGSGSVLNISGNYFRFNTSGSAMEADVKALRSDWGMVGEDFQIAAEHIHYKPEPAEK